MACLKITVIRKITIAATLTAVPQDKQRSVIPFLTPENISVSEIQIRMWVVYGVQNAITKSTATVRHRDLRRAFDYIQYY